MKCPYCSFEESKVIDSRPTEDGERIRRRRECLQCGKRFTTYEYVESVPIVVIKKDGSRQAFDREKLFKVILVACGKRPVPVDVINQMIDEIETDVQNTGQQEVESSVIGELVMQKLKAVDEVAYGRFASVYRQFTDIGTFQKELNKLIDGN